jgi:hypothetical protein
MKFYEGINWECLWSFTKESIENVYEVLRSNQLRMSMKFYEVINWECL